LGDMNKRRQGRLRNSHTKRRVVIELLKRDGRNCHWCGEWMTWSRAKERKGRTPTDLTIDHVQPLAKGGSNRDDNLVLACRDCNEDRGLEDYLAHKRYRAEGEIGDKPVA
jgi:5-methylcytosine-specific restriction endonuclease McrA